KKHLWRSVRAPWALRKAPLALRKGTSRAPKRTPRAPQFSSRTVKRWSEPIFFSADLAIRRLECLNHTHLHAVQFQSEHHSYRIAARYNRAAMSDVTRILEAIEGGDPSAAEQLLPLVYDELRKLAARKLSEEKPGQTLDATALVHEAYLRLVGPADSQ